MRRGCHSRCHLTFRAYGHSSRCTDQLPGGSQHSVAAAGSAGVSRRCRQHGARIHAGVERDQDIRASERLRLPDYLRLDFWSGSAGYHKHGDSPSGPRAKATVSWNRSSTSPADAVRIFGAADRMHDARNLGHDGCCRCRRLGFRPRRTLADDLLRRAIGGLLRRGCGRMAPCGRSRSCSAAHQRRRASVQALGKETENPLCRAGILFL